MFRVMTMRACIAVTLLTFGLSARAESCANTYAKASARYLTKVEREVSWARAVSKIGPWGAGATFVGCAWATLGWGTVLCVLPAGAVYLATDIEPSTAYLQRAGQIHQVYFLYNQYKQGSIEASIEVHAFAQATGWSGQENQLLAEVARAMEAGDLCQAGAPSVGYDELVTQLKR